MADEITGNGQGNPTAAPGFDASQQQMIVNAQYIKDLSFENPNAPKSLLQPAGQPSVEINVDVKGTNIGPDLFEVVLTINTAAKVQDETVFLVELAYAAVVTVRNVPEALLPSVVLVETPRLIFPFARNIIADAVRDGGFPPLMINPIDFSALLQRQQSSGGQMPAGAANA